MTGSAALTRRPTTAALADAAGAKLPAYVTRDQARAVITAAATTRDRLLFECLWQTGGRVTGALGRPRSSAPSTGVRGGGGPLA